MGGRGHGANGDEQAGGASGAGEKTRKHGYGLTALMFEPEFPC
jgi:hypothetical protein